jgi:ankyrin repeat protein
VVERLLRERADINAVAAKNGRTVLQAAAEGGHLAVVDRLLREKVDIDATGVRAHRNTALEIAAKRGHLAVVVRLQLFKSQQSSVHHELNTSEKCLGITKRRRFV